MRTPLTLALLIAAAAFVPAQWLRYDRAAVLHGEVGRVWTCHLVHASLAHAALNGLALAALAVCLRLRWTWVLVATATATSVGILALRPDVALYVGLSGVLHGVFAAGALRRRRQWLLLPLAAKLAWEQWQGPLTPGPVLVDAHLYGAIAGLVAGALSRLRWSTKNGANAIPQSA